jgi:isopropylmalate/homocitrate/citramalate synthase
MEKFRSQKGNAREIFFTDVTLRDGQQQRTNDVSLEQRLEIFNKIIGTGLDRIEIGHLGNSNGDQQLARLIVKSLAEKPHQNKNLKIQVLFGSQQDIIQQGIEVLQQAYQESYGENWQTAMADQVVVHVYDRLDENLRNTSSVYYTAEESAQKVCEASSFAIKAGFKNFSISGEATSAVSLKQAIKYYKTINDYLFANGAVSVNNNFANTYGYSPNQNWDYSSLKAFNDAVKKGNASRVTTSIHAHNDTNGAIDFSIIALKAGFDRVESTHIGMGERVGNVATVDIMARLIEQAKFATDTEQQVDIANSSLSKQQIIKHGKNVLTFMFNYKNKHRPVKLGKNIVDCLLKYYETGQYLSEVFGPHADYRFKRTIIGNDYIFDNGSGPHDQALASAVIDPVNNPPYKNYEWVISLAHMMGHPLAHKLAIGDPVAVDAVTVAGFTGGGKTKAIKQGALKRASAEQIALAEQNFDNYIKQIGQTMLKGFAIN